jgi:DNA-binding transcriptional ArsR family regulator
VTAPRAAQRSDHRASVAAIRFHLADSELERFRFTYAPLQEAAFSLHVLVEPQHHPLHHRWVREMRQLPADLRRELSACAFVFGATLPDPLARFPEHTMASFEDGLADLRRLPMELVSSALEPLVPDDADGSPEKAAAAREAREDPGGFFERLCALLERYWHATFATKWERLEPQLAASVAEARGLLAAGGLEAFIATLEPRVYLRRGHGRVVLEIICVPQWGAPPEMDDIDVDVPGSFTFVPSAFSWPHAWASVEPPWPLGISYASSELRREARRRVPPDELVRLLRATGDDVRLRILRWIAESPRTTQELAPLVGISEPALSRHLRRLTDAGLLATRREGRYVLYHLRGERLESLVESLLAYLRARG